MLKYIYTYFFFQCIPLPGLGFRRGSYKCVCRRGFYFPDTQAERRYYNGTVIEEEYEKLMLVSIRPPFSLKEKKKLYKDCKSKKIKEKNDNFITVMQFVNYHDHS